MTKEELVEHVTAIVSRERNLPRAAVKDVIEALGQVVRTGLVANGDVPIPGVGKIVVRQRAARAGRNPRTGAPLSIPPRLVAVLEPSSGLKKAMNPDSQE